MKVTSWFVLLIMILTILVNQVSIVMKHAGQELVEVNDWALPLSDIEDATEASEEEIVDDTQCPVKRQIFTDYRLYNRKPVHQINWLMAIFKDHHPSVVTPPPRG